MKYKLKNIEIVITLLKKNNIKNIVISPGGTNIAFVKAVQDDPFFNCYSIVDERSAIYFAIGLYLQIGEPIVASCTSAQATRNYIPGLTEAFYKNIPILAITMSKHPRFTYQEYMQAPDQTSLPNDAVKKSYSMPFISDVNDIYHSIRIVNEAILELSHNGCGPIQLCIPWLDFPLPKINPEIRQIKRYSLNNDSLFDFYNKKIMIVIGEHRPFKENEIDVIEKFSETYNVVIYTNHLSNYNGKYSIKGNLAMLTLDVSEFRKKYKPDIIISLGGQTGDYPLYNMISRVDIEGMEHWRINEDGNVVDTYDRLTKIFVDSIAQFFEKCNKIMLEKDQVYNHQHEYYKLWKSRINDLKYSEEYPFSHITVAQKLSKIIPSNSIIQFAILNSLRIWNFFELDSSIQCFSNVGAFGIDGGMSTLIGQSMVTDELCFMVTGDLAFYYDMNSLAIKHIKNNLRILIVNNNGGIEFKLGNVNYASYDRYIAASGHYKNAKGWSQTCGFSYLSARNEEELKQNLIKFISKSTKPVVLEVFVSDKNEASAYHKIINDNKKNSLANSINFGARKIIRNILDR